MFQEAEYQIALSQIKGIGPIQSKVLLSEFGTAKHVFEATKSDLLHIEGFAQQRVNQFINSKAEALHRAQEEIKFLRAHPENRIITTKDIEFPNRLHYCNDSPSVLFASGNMKLNTPKVLAIVGTRKMTDYGRSLIQDLLFEIKDLNILVVSGLAYGTDTFVHKTCVENNIPTVGVLAHGLDRIYPMSNTHLVREMKKNGGVITEYLSKTRPNRENFPSRNRIIAGLSDAVIVTESKMRGGSLITAEIANSYSRDVFAFPGNVNQSSSAGCNDLIRKQKAMLIESAKDVRYHLGWESLPKHKMNRQRKLFVELTNEEQQIVESLKEGSLGIEDIAYKCELPISIVRTKILTLELKGVIRILPGNRFDLN